jgi:hypothetical protein
VAEAFCLSGSRDEVVRRQGTAAKATDCIITLLAERTRRSLFAVESLLNREQLLAIGARQMPKKLAPSKKAGGRDRDRTCDPYHVKVPSARLLCSSN